MAEALRVETWSCDNHQIILESRTPLADYMYIYCTPVQRLEARGLAPLRTHRTVAPAAPLNSINSAI